MKSLIKNGMTIICLAVIIAVVLPAQAGKKDKDKDKGNNNGAIQALQAEDDNLHRRIDAIEDGGTGPDLSGYGVSFSAEGTPKNVVVLSQNLGDGNTLYKIRSRYANSTELISINTIRMIKPFIANNVKVVTDGSGSIISIDNSIDVPDTTSYVNYNVEQSTYEFGEDGGIIIPLVKTVIHDTKREVFTCSGSTVQLCTSYAIDVKDDKFSYIYTWSSIRALGGPYTFNDMTFDDVRMESYTAPSGKSRIRAKGIGMIFEENNNGNDHDGQQIIIYYQANGSSVGKLEGTPFDTGQPLYGLFF